MSKKSQKIIRHMVIKIKPAAMKKASPKTDYSSFMAPSRKKIVHKGWVIYTDSLGKYVTGRYVRIKGKRVRKVISGGILSVIKTRIDRLYNSGARDD